MRFIYANEHKSVCEVTRTSGVWYDCHEKKQLDTSAHGRSSVGINMNVVKYGSFSRCTRKSTYPASMSKYGYDYQCE